MAAVISSSHRMSAPLYIVLLLFFVNFKGVLVMDETAVDRISPKSSAHREKTDDPKCMVSVCPEPLSKQWEELNEHCCRERGVYHCQEEYVGIWMNSIVSACMQPVSCPPGTFFDLRNAILTAKATNDNCRACPSSEFQPEITPSHHFVRAGCRKKTGWSSVPNVVCVRTGTSVVDTASQVGSQRHNSSPEADLPAETRRNPEDAIQVLRTEQSLQNYGLQVLTESQAALEVAPAVPEAKAIKAEAKAEAKELEAEAKTKRLTAEAKARRPPVKVEAKLGMEGLEPYSEAEHELAMRAEAEAEMARMKADMERMQAKEAQRRVEQRWQGRSLKMSLNVDHRALLREIPKPHMIRRLDLSSNVVAWQPEAKTAAGFAPREARQKTTSAKTEANSAPREARQKTTSAKTEADSAPRETADKTTSVNTKTKATVAEAESKEAEILRQEELLLQKGEENIQQNRHYINRRTSGLSQKSSLWAFVPHKWKALVWKYKLKAKASQAPVHSEEESSVVLSLASLRIVLMLILSILIFYIVRYFGRRVINKTSPTYIRTAVGLYAGNSNMQAGVSNCLNIVPNAQYGPASNFIEKTTRGDYVGPAGFRRQERLVYVKLHTESVGVVYKELDNILPLLSRQYGHLELSIDSKRRHIGITVDPDKCKHKFQALLFIRDLLSLKTIRKELQGHKIQVTICDPQCLENRSMTSTSSRVDQLQVNSGELILRFDSNITNDTVLAELIAAEDRVKDMFSDFRLELTGIRKGSIVLQFSLPHVTETFNDLTVGKQTEKLAQELLSDPAFNRLWQAEPTLNIEFIVKGQLEHITAVYAENLNMQVGVSNYLNTVPNAQCRPASSFNEESTRGDYTANLIHSTILQLSLSGGEPKAQQLTPAQDVCKIIVTCPEEEESEEDGSIIQMLRDEWSNVESLLQNWYPGCHLNLSKKEIVWEIPLEEDRNSFIADVFSIQRISKAVENKVVYIAVHTPVLPEDAGHSKDHARNIVVSGFRLACVMLFTQWLLKNLWQGCLFMKENIVRIRAGFQLSVAVYFISRHCIPAVIYSIVVYASYYFLKSPG